MRIKVKRVKGNISRQDLKKFLQGINEIGLAVGFFSSARYDDGTPVASVAATQEFGSPSQAIPPRPFMRPVIADNSSEWPEFVEPLFAAVVRGESTVEQALDLLGAKIAGEIRSKIASISEPALSPVTLALRKLKLKGEKITGATVRAVGRAVAEGKTGPGQLGDSSGVNPKPLVFDGIMIGSVTHALEPKGENE